MDPKNKKKKKKAAYPSNFLEALRDLGSDVTDSAVHDAAVGIPKDIFDQLMNRQRAGHLQPGQALELNQLPQERPAERTPERFQREFLNLQSEERLVYKRAEEETKFQIEAVLQELKKLAFSTKDLAQEVEVAAQQVLVEPGTYHLNFFEKLRQTIIFLKKKIDESATWLSAFNQKAKKRNHYWAQVKKSGTKFMLSQERYMATQAG